MSFVDFIGSNAAATISSTILSGLLMFFTVRTSRQSRKQQKEIHNRDVLIAREQRMLNIHHIFTDCCRTLKLNEFYDLVRLNIEPDAKKIVNKIIEYRSTICKALDEARLICGDCLLLKVLENVWKEFSALSCEEMDLFIYQSQVLQRALLQIKQEFPGVDVFPITNILNNAEASKRFSQLILNPKIEEYDAKVQAFWSQTLSYENFDKYFEPFLVRKKL